jgi:hypothetical protein
MFRSISRTKRDCVFTPERTMVPVAVIELQHHRLRWVCWINPAVGEQFITFANFQRRRGTREEVLTHGISLTPS